MFLEDPPPTASAPNRRRGKFTDIVRNLMDQPDRFWNITDDIDAALEEAKDERYYEELARAISGGNRASFTPRGAFEGRSEGKKIWAKYISPNKRKVVAADPADPEGAVEPEVTAADAARELETV